MDIKWISLQSAEYKELLIEQEPLKKERRKLLMKSNTLELRI